VLAVYVGEAGFVEVPFGGDAALLFLAAGAFAARHHHPGVLRGFGRPCAGRGVAGQSGQDRENRLPPGLVGYVRPQAR
jgi:hypothetical protein